uniref:F-box domain-containing protein n=1 Tax=Elaeophora elaphi TaxID=1147741 RepID=A0A0R3S147_9BILA
MEAITESPGRYWPVSHKYDTIDRRYKFFEPTYSSQMEAYYPSVQPGRSIHSFFQRKDTALKSQKPIENEKDVDKYAQNSDVEKETLTTINDLPNDILLTIFAYCHPIDLIHCFSLVSRRWNYLANQSALFTEVRVLVYDISLKYGSVKKFFQKTSRHLRKLCIDCSVPLPSAQVNALFDICFPNVVHLDISSFKEMDTTLLKRLSHCFPNVKTLHMDKVERSSSQDENAEEWKKTLKMLFEDENIFPKVQNFFVGDVREYTPETDPKLPACKRPLNLLYIYEGTGCIDFVDILTSPWRSTLTELYLGSFIRNDGIEYIGYLHNLKVFSWGLSLYTSNEELAPIKNLYNLEQLRIFFGGEDCFVSASGLITLFTLPEKDPEKSFPYKLQHLIIGNYYEGSVDLFRTIDRKRLIFLDLSDFGDCYKDEVWSNLSDDDLPDLRFLKLHGNKVNIENLQRLNLRRPKMLISTKCKYFINWTETENGCVFHDTFDGDIRAVMNDLHQIDGCRGFVVHPELFMSLELSVRIDIYRKHAIIAIL